jgi:hypothetical protein
MDNPETQAILGTRHRTKTNKTKNGQPRDTSSCVLCLILPVSLGSAEFIFLFYYGGVRVAHRVSLLGSVEFIFLFVRGISE